MVSKKKKKYSTGEGSQFISRKQALKKLQLTLNDFRKLCIIKGIYPREPRNRKRAQKGQTGIKTLYHVKDIQFLMHEPIIWTLREYKIFHRKVGRAKALRDFSKMKKYLKNHPTLKLDHIVKERYPTFIDALRDLDDCLTLCFLFSTFPSLRHISPDLSLLCRRLTIEFMHAVIEAKALRKVFISIKGYYYQAEIKGQTITWIVPHHFSFEPQSKQEVDFKVMATFVEFYVIMLGFVNYRLYHSLNLFYPPKLGVVNTQDSENTLVDKGSFVSERVAALNIPLTKMSAETVDEEVEIDDFPEQNPEKIEQAKEEREKIKKLKTLFKGLKFFLNREVPREPLVFIIRCFGGEVSWDKNFFVGSTFCEDDETITHQIADRPSMEKQYISRYYIQPQWVFDCVNARELLPVNKYFLGEVLPPHLSPFVDSNRNPFEEYIPPEERMLMDPSFAEEIQKQRQKDEEMENEEVEEEEVEEEETEEKEEEEENNTNIQNELNRTDEREENTDEEIAEIQPKKNKLSVTPGQVYKEEPWAQKKLDRQEYKLRAKMIKKKHRKIYRGIMRNRREKAKEAWLLKKKRKLIEEKQKEKNPLSKSSVKKASTKS